MRYNIIKSLSLAPKITHTMKCLLAITSFLVLCSSKSASAVATDNGTDERHRLRGNPPNKPDFVPKKADFDPKDDKPYFAPKHEGVAPKDYKSGLLTYYKPYFIPKPGESVPNCSKPGPPAVALESETDRGCGNAKKVRIYKFWINGDDDAGAEGEHQLRLDGAKYFPKRSTDCKQSDSGFCDWREGHHHNVNGDWQMVASHKSLTVGTEEHDDWSENDSYSATMAASEWNIDTCETYQVILSRDFEQKKQKSLCWDLSASLSAELKGVNGKLTGGVKECSSWTEPAQSYVWYLSVASKSRGELNGKEELSAN